MKLTTKTSVVLLAALSTVAVSGAATSVSAATVDSVTSNVGATFKAGGGTNGAISIDSASDWKFGELEIAAKDAVYYAQPEDATNPLTVQVTDVRGSFAGWTLTLTQPDQFTDGTNELIGAALSFKGTGTTTSTSTAPASSNPAEKGFTLTPGAAQTILAAKINEGMGENVYSFGAIADYDNTAIDGKQAATKGPVELSVAAGSMRAADYTTSLVWTLEDTPAP